MEGDEMEEAMRAYFPLSFGKPSKAQSNPSLAHSATRRSAPAPAASASKPNPRPTGYEEDDGPMVGPPPPPPASRVEDEGEEEAMIGPPRPPPISRVDDDEGEEDAMVGPPRPPPQLDQKPSSSAQDGSTDESDEELDEDSPDDAHRIPLSNEVVLRGHTKVVFDNQFVYVIYERQYSSSFQAIFQWRTKK